MVFIKFAKQSYSTPFYLALWFSISYVVAVLAVQFIGGIAPKFVVTTPEYEMLSQKLLWRRTIAILFFSVIYIASLRAGRFFGVISFVGAVWTISMFVDDQIALRPHLLVPENTTAIILLSLRPLFLLTISWMALEHFLRYGKRRDM